MIHVENGESNFKGEPMEIISDISVLLIHFMKDKNLKEMFDVAVAFLEMQAKSGGLPDAELTTNVKEKGQFEA